MRRRHGARNLGLAPHRRPARPRLGVARRRRLLLALPACAALLLAAAPARANNPPIIKKQYLYTELDLKASIWLSYSDPDGPTPFTVSIVAQPLHGSLVHVADDDPLQPRHYEFTPEAGYHGFDQFQFKVTDGKGNVSQLATVRMLVNQKPVAHDQSIPTLLDQAVSVTLDYSDDGLPPLPPAFTIQQQPQHGTLTQTGGSTFLYTPNPGYIGSDKFQWTMNDGKANSNWGKVSITVYQLPVLEVTPEVVNWVETLGTDVARTTVELVNAGGSPLEWRVTPSNPLVSASPSSGIVTDQPTPIEVSVNLRGLPAGNYGGQLTFAALGADPLVVPFSLVLTDMPGKNIGLEDMIELKLSADGSGGPGGDFAFVNGPGEPPALEVSLLPKVAVAWLFLTAPQDLSSTGYIELDLDAPVGSWIQPVLLERAPGGDVWWGVNTDYVYVPGNKHIHLPIEDFHAWNIPPDRPIDLADVTQIQLKLSIPVAGEYGYPGSDDLRRLRLADLRATESSVDIFESDAAGSATVTVDATAQMGTMVRPWEGLIAFQGADVFLTDLGLRQTRESTMDVNDWTVNDDLMRGVGDYDFTKVDDTYRRFDPSVEHLPWIPTIPFFLWQVKDPDILGDDGRVPRPKYAFMPPSSYPAWQTVVADFVRYHYDQGYNIKGFSILNEPDNRAFWQGTPTEAFEFYVKTAAAIKGVDPAIKVAGPSTAGTASPLEIQQFLDYCAAHDAPVDYLSFHGYTAGAPGSTLYEAARMADDQLARYGARFADTKLVLNEWGYGLSKNYEARNQSPIAAASVASSFKGIVDGGYDSALWFSLNAMDSPEYYGSGLFDFDGLSARPTLYAFDLFNRLGATRVVATIDKPEAGVEALAAIDPGTGVVRLIAWWHERGNGHEVASKLVSLDLNLPLGVTYDWERLVVDDQHGNFVPGVGYAPLQPVEIGTLRGPLGRVNFELPLYGTSMVTLTPR